MITVTLYNKYQCANGIEFEICELHVHLHYLHDILGYRLNAAPLTSQKLLAIIECPVGVWH